MRTGAIFVATLASPISTVAGYGVAAIVGSHWQLNFLISGVGLVTLALTWELTSRILSPYATVSEPVHESKITVETKESFLRTMMRSGLFVFLAIAMFKSIYDYAVKGFSPSIISNLYDEVTTVLATVMNIVILIVGAVGTVSAYFISKHIRNEAVVIAVCFSIALPLTAFTLLVGKVNYWFIVIALSFAAMLMGICTLYTTSFVAARFNSIGRGATVAGTINCIACMGIVLTNTVFPRIADSLGWYAVVVSWVILMSVAVAFTFVLIPIWTKFLKSR
jgi:predicted MFS family arabinose efflux permease